MPLFNVPELRRKLASLTIPDDIVDRSMPIIAKWQHALTAGTLSKTKETSVQGQFLQRIMEDCLGYVFQTSSTGAYNLIAEFGIGMDSADGSIGFYDNNLSKTLGVIELKDAATSLDRKQLGRERKETPIEQAYRYANKVDTCRWIIVSNFKEIRLYSRHRSQDYYETFDLLELSNPEEFKRFYFLLARENLIGLTTDSRVDELLQRSTELSKEITQNFYNEYKEARLHLFRHLMEQNPGESNDLLLQKTQKILDRFIFICFCEDSGRALLPTKSIKRIVTHAEASFDDADDLIWKGLQSLFKAIDKGNVRSRPPINAYNGGLFATDNILDSLVITDEGLKPLIALSGYDFETDLDVNVLGHVFEQSISDLESVRAEMNGEVTGKSGRKRNKEGIFYTPRHITKLIVECTLGAYLEEYPERLEQVRILDPAVGSGAFLNQAHTQLKSIYASRRAEMEAEAEVKAARRSRAKTSSGMAAPKVGLLDIVNGSVEVRKDLSNEWAYASDAKLLRHLYGVDLNDESVEISKLSLWLKTASKTEPLLSLDHNIVVGNSVVDDLAISEKAFDWNQAFGSILAEGGFDIVVGNPPYVDSESMTKNSPDERAHISKSFDSAAGNWDLYIPFIEQAWNKLRDTGYLGFITPNKWLSIAYGAAIRKIVFSGLVMVCDYRELGRVFDDANITPITFILQKENQRGEVKVRRYSDETTYIEHSVVRSELSEDSLGLLLAEDLLSIQVMRRHATVDSFCTASGAFTTGEAYEFAPILHRGTMDADAADYFKFVNTGTIEPNFNLWATSKLRYLGNDFEYPVVKRTDFKREFPRRYARFGGAKIIVSGIRHFECFLDSGNEYIAGKSTSVLTGFKVDARYMDAVLNSSHVKMYIKGMYESMGMGGGINFTPKVIDKIPVPSNTETEVAKICELRDKLVEQLKTSMAEYRRLKVYVESQVEMAKPLAPSFFRLDWSKVTKAINADKNLRLSDRIELSNHVNDKGDWLVLQEREVGLLRTQLDNLLWIGYERAPSE